MKYLLDTHTFIWVISDIGKLSKFFSLKIGSSEEKVNLKGDGLQNLHNRAATCKGRLDIVSAPGKGTEATIEFKNEQD
jgi:signal transduction histidine kinase